MKKKHGGTAKFFSHSKTCWQTKQINGVEKLRRLSTSELEICNECRANDRVHSLNTNNHHLTSVPRFSRELVSILMSVNRK